MLAGYLAASFSKSGKVGDLRRPRLPGRDPVHGRLLRRRPVLQPAEGQDRRGPRLGRLLPDPTKTGTFVGGSGGTDTWNDPAKGEQFAKTFLDQGVDIVHPVAGETGNGTIKAMLAAGKWAIGVDNDQAITIPEYAGAILTSAQKAIDVSVLDVIKKTSGGDLGGKDYSGTLANKRRRCCPLPRLRQPDLGRDQDRARGAEGGDRRGSVKVCSYLGRGC